MRAQGQAYALGVNQQAAIYGGPVTAGEGGVLLDSQGAPIGAVALSWLHHVFQAPIFVPLKLSSHSSKCRTLFFHEIVQQLLPCCGLCCQSHSCSAAEVVDILG